MKCSVERSILIDASLADVKPHLLDLSRWQAWSPWTVLEPDHEHRVEGELQKVGSSMHWDGKVIGSGQLTITSISDQRIDYDLAFFTPWKSEAKTAFTLAESSGSTKVTWTMDSQMPFFLFFMVGTIQAMVGMDYDRGLGMLKSVVETGAVDADTQNLGVIDFTGFDYLGLPRTSFMHEMPEHMGGDFEKLMSACKEQGFEPEHVLSVYTKVKMSKQLFSYESSVSGVGMEKITDSLVLKPGAIKSQKMLEIKHRGSYQYIGNAWAMGHLTMRAEKLKQNGSPFEYYHNDPSDTAENELLTSVYFPIKG